MTSSASALAPKRPAPALSELLTATVAVFPVLLSAYGPRVALRPARREALFAEAATAADAPGAAWCHRGWAEFLGATLDDQLDALVALGQPDVQGRFDLDPDTVSEVLGEDALAVVELAVAMGELAGHVEGAARRLLRPGWSALAPTSVLRNLGDLATVASAAPVALVNLAAGATLHVVNRTVPAVPEVELVDPEPNLLAHLLAAATPSYLSHALVRGVVLRLPMAIVLGIQAGPQGATVRIAGGIVQIANGIADDVLAVVESDGGLLASAGLGALTRELRRPTH